MEATQPGPAADVRSRSKIRPQLKSVTQAYSTALVTGNPPNRVGGTPIEGLAGLVRARARRGPSSRQKYIRLAFLAIFLYKMLVA